MQLGASEISCWCGSEQRRTRHNLKRRRFSKDLWAQYIISPQIQTSPIENKVTWISSLVLQKTLLGAFNPAGNCEIPARHGTKTSTMSSSGLYTTCLRSLPWIPHSVMYEVDKATIRIQSLSSHYLIRTLYNQFIPSLGPKSMVPKVCATVLRYHIFCIFVE